MVTTSADNSGILKSKKSNSNKSRSSNSREDTKDKQPPVRSPSTTVHSPLASEDVHLPGPHPARGIYGFALYITVWLLLVLYLIWAFVPTPVLKRLGITYVPSKIWAIAFPALLPVLATLFVLCLTTVNIYNFRGYRIFDDVEIVDNDFGEHTVYSEVLKSISSSESLVSKTSRASSSASRGGASLQKREYGTKADIRRIKLQYKHMPSSSKHADRIHHRLQEEERAALEFDYQLKEAEKEWVPDSLLTENLIRSDTARFGKILERREQEKQKLLNEKRREMIESGEITENAEEERDSAGTQTFPFDSTLNVQTMSRVPQKELENESSTPELNTIDRGFYVDTNAYVDEYVAGTTKDLPQDDITMPTRWYFGADDAVEHIDFQLPSQATDPLYEEGKGARRINKKKGNAKIAMEETLDEELKMTDEEYERMSLVGTVDPERPATNVNCAGCGANLHCKDSSLPGFLPLEVLENVERQVKRKQIPQQLCRRCHLLKHHNFLLNVNVCDVDYKSMMSHLQLKEEALIIMVVDITDLPGSIYSQLPDIIGDNKPMIVVANKLDLLPPDAQSGYMKRFKEAVEMAIEKKGFRQRFNVLHTALISAKTGFGIEDLITEIFLKYTNVRMGIRSDIYLVGCTNSGKSTLFNAFLQSDLCKVRAIDLVERATTSVWPGTTISLLKFPVMKPTPFRLELRRRRLLTKMAWKQKEERYQRLLYAQSNNEQFVIPIDTIQNTFKEREEELRVLGEGELKGLEERDDEKEKVWSARDPVFHGGKWCYDTPGTVNRQQCLNLFTLDELIRVLPRRLIRPRTALLNVGQSLLIGGVARIDINQAGGQGKVLLTTFASADLPLNIMKTEEVENFLSKYLGKRVLSVPCGNSDRMAKWPGLESRQFELRGKWKQACGDIVLSSIGWCTVTTDSPTVELTAYTPGGRGLTARQPMHPHAAALKGKRIAGTQFYSVGSLTFPEDTQVNKRRRARRVFQGSPENQ